MAVELDGIPEDYLVSAYHPMDKFRLDRARVRIGRDRANSTGVHGYYASLGAFGCGRSKSTIQKAIEDLLLSNGCTQIHIHGPA